VPGLGCGLARLSLRLAVSERPDQHRPIISHDRARVVNGL